MTRKDYRAIASVIKWNKENQPTLATCTNPTDIVLNRVANELANIMQQDNVNFDYSKFKTACGFPGF